MALKSTYSNTICGWKHFSCMEINPSWAGEEIQTCSSVDATCIDLTEQRSSVWWACCVTGMSERSGLWGCAVNQSSGRAFTLTFTQQRVHTKNVLTELSQYEGSLTKIGFLLQSISRLCVILNVSFYGVKYLRFKPKMIIGSMHLPHPYTLYQKVGGANVTWSIGCY